MTKRLLLTIFLGLLSAQTVWATRGDDDPLIWVLPLAMVILVLFVTAIIYLVGRFLLKKEGSFWFTLLGSFLGMIIFVALMFAIIELKVRNNLFFDMKLSYLYYPLTILGGVLGYYISHRRRMNL